MQLVQPVLVVSEHVAQSAWHAAHTRGAVPEAYQPVGHRHSPDSMAALESAHAVQPVFVPSVHDEQSMKQDPQANGELEAVK